VAAAIERLKVPVTNAARRFETGLNSRAEGRSEDRGAREIHDRPSLSSFSSDAKAYLRTRKSATSDGEAAMALLVCRSNTIIIHLPAIR